MHGENLGAFEELANPGHHIPPLITELTGITNDMVMKARPSADVVRDFLAWAEPESILVAHNAGFDAGFIATTLVQSGQELPDNKILDTLTWARKTKLAVPDHKLGTLLRHIKFDPGALHRALADARGVMELVLFLMEKSKSPETLKDLSRCANLSDLCSFAYTEEILPKRFDGLQEAIEAGLPCTITYSGGSKGKRPRSIQPRGVMNIKGKPYLVAWCPIDKVEKSFRLDRITSLAVNDDAAESEEVENQ